MDWRKSGSGACVHVAVPQAQTHHPLYWTTWATVPQKEMGVPITEGLRGQPVPPGDVPHGRCVMPPSLCHPAPPSAAPSVLHPNLHSGHSTAAVFLAGCAEPKGQRVSLASLPLPSVPDGPSPLAPRIPRSGCVHNNREPMAAPCQTKRSPLTRFPDGQHGVLPPGPPPTGYGALPLQASSEEPTGAGLRVGHGGPPFARKQDGVIRVLYPGGEEAFPLRSPGPQDAAPCRHPSPEDGCPPPHTPPAGLEAAMAPEQAAPTPRCNGHEPKQPPSPACPAPPADGHGPPVAMPDPTSQSPLHGACSVGLVALPSDTVNLPAAAGHRKNAGAHAVTAFQSTEIIPCA